MAATCNVARAGLIATGTQTLDPGEGHASQRAVAALAGSAATRAAAGPAYGAGRQPQACGLRPSCQCKQPRPGRRKGGDSYLPADYACRGDRSAGCPRLRTASPGRCGTACATDGAAYTIGERDKLDELELSHWLTLTYRHKAFAEAVMRPHE